MADLGTLTVRIVGDSTQFDKSLDTAEKRMKATGDKMARIGAQMTKFVTLPILGLGAAFIKTASDAEETESKFNTVFRDIARTADEGARRIARSFGLTVNKTQELLGNTGDLLTGFGFTQDAAFDLASQVTELSVDLASFTNFQGGAEGASAALTKALLGERESVKSLGISILEEDVKLEILQLRQEGITFETERQAKAFATLRIAQRQSQNAIGDYQRTADQFANSWRVLRGRVVEVAQSFGKQLLPIATKVVQFFTKFSEALTDMDPQFQRWILLAGALAAAIGPGVGLAGVITKSVIPAVRKLTVTLIANPIIAVAAAMTALITAATLYAKRQEEMINRSFEMAAAHDDVVEAARKQIDATGGVNEQTAEQIRLTREAAKEALTATLANFEQVASLERLRTVGIKFLEERNRALKNLEAAAELTRQKLAGLEATEQELADVQITAADSQAKLNAAYDETDETLDELRVKQENAVDLLLKELDIREALGEEIDRDQILYENLGEIIVDFGKKGLFASDRVRGMFNRARDAVEELNAAMEEFDRSRARESDRTNRRILAEQEANQDRIDKALEAIEKEKEEKQKQAEAEAEIAEQRQALVDKFYDNTLDRIAKEKEAFIEAGVAKVDADKWEKEQLLEIAIQSAEEIAEVIQQFSDIALGIYQNITQSRLDALEIERQTVMENIDAELEAALEAAGVRELTQQERLANRIAALQEELASVTDEARQEEIEKTIAELEGQQTRLGILEDFNAQREAEEERLAAEERKIIREQAIVKRTAGLLEVAISTAIAVAKAFADYGFPVGIPFATLATAMGIAQAALILSQPLPALAVGGRVLPRAGGTAVIMGEAGVPEVAIPETPTAFAQLAAGIGEEIRNQQQPLIENNFSPVDDRPINLNIGGRELAVWITDQIKRKNILVDRRGLV